MGPRTWRAGALVVLALAAAWGCDAGGDAARHDGSGREEPGARGSAPDARTGGPPPEIMMPPAAPPSVTDSPRGSSFERAAPGRGTPPGAPILSGEIVFVSERDGQPQVYAVPAAGGATRQLTRGPHGAYPGPVSPNGRRVAVVWAAEGGGGHTEQIAVQALGAAAGRGPRALTARSARVRNPSWSPDGRWLAFEADFDGFREIYRVDADGSAPQRLTRNPEGNFEPAVSPDGRFIAFTSSRDGVNQIYRMRADGSDQRRLAAFHRDEWGAAWSPDGGRIAFVSRREGADRVFVMRADGTGQRRLRREIAVDPLPPPHTRRLLGDTTRAPEPRPRAGSAWPAVAESQPAWSPDGRRVALVVHWRGRTAGRIHLADAARPDETTGAVPCPAESCDQPAWSPDGRHIAFVAGERGNADVWVMQAGGTDARRLTTSPAADWLPRWSAGSER